MPLRQAPEDLPHASWGMLPSTSEDPPPCLWGLVHGNTCGMRQPIVLQAVLGFMFVALPVWHPQVHF